MQWFPPWKRRNRRGCIDKENFRSSCPAISLPCISGTRWRDVNCDKLTTEWEPFRNRPRKDFSLPLPLVVRWTVRKRKLCEGMTTTFRPSAGIRTPHLCSTLLSHHSTNLRRSLAYAKTKIYVANGRGVLRNNLKRPVRNVRQRDEWWLVPPMHFFFGIKHKF
jgi:hypothetical protein